MQKYHIIKHPLGPTWMFRRQAGTRSIRSKFSDRPEALRYARTWLRRAFEKDKEKRELCVHKANGMVDWIEKFPGEPLADTPELQAALDSSMTAMPGPDNFYTHLDAHLHALPPDHRLEVIPPTYPPISLDRIWKMGDREETVHGKKGHVWRIPDLCALLKDEPVYDMPLIFMDLSAHKFDIVEGGLFAFAQHMKHVMECDLDIPIILDEWGEVLDGRHRIVKALIEGHSTIKMQRVPIGTSPTYYKP